MAEFVDRVKVFVVAGNGGHGCASVRREKFKPLGGPDGGNGGDGGSVTVRVDPNVTTLLSFHQRPHHKAGNGEPGKGDFRQGRNGSDVVLLVPAGTVVKTGNGELLADLRGPGAEVVVAAGGKGGLGNAALANKARKAPGFALLGEPGDETEAILELKSVADVALVGYPSAGKSSLIAAMSSARPKIADYPFTTLIPNLGVVQAGDERFTVADVPGLIPGASEGRGLGLEFLRHIERCAVIAHVIDCATFEPDRDPLSDLRTIEAELAAYQGDLGSVEGYVPIAERPRLVILNKIDVPDGRDIAELMRPDLEELGYPVFDASAVTHEGLSALAYAMAAAVAEHRSSLPDPEAARVVLTPRAVGACDAVTVRTVQYGGETVYQVRGSKPERWVRQTDFSNDEAVGYLADRLAAVGVEDQLVKAGAVPGSPVVIGELDGGMVFDWEPTLATGAELLGGRGQDLRLNQSGRRTTSERREEYSGRMGGKEEARQELWTERGKGIWTDPADASDIEDEAE